MTIEDVRRENASLHDRIEQVLEMHPELREFTEATALRQDLHVEVGAPFLDRTQRKLVERVRAIVQQRPELGSYFQDLSLTAAATTDASREARLVDALRANAKLRERAEELIAAYIEPGSDREARINDLIRLFDGPEQREAQRLAQSALGEDFGNNA